MSYNTQNFKLALGKVEEWLKKEYLAIHTGLASPTVLDGIMVDSYGTKMPVKNVSQIGIEDSKTLRIIPWDKEQIKAIENAIMTADLGLSVTSDGDGVRVVFPMLTTENREKLVKILKEKMENARIRIRQERQTEIDKLKDLTEDEEKKAKDDIQKVVDEANKNLEKILENKEKAVMG